MMTARVAAIGALLAAVAAATLLGLAVAGTPGATIGTYLSELGAAGGPRRGPYAAGVLAAAVAVALVGVALWRTVRDAAAVLAVSAGLLVLSATVPCTRGCPLPLADGVVGVTDALHAGSSAGALATAGAAMVLTSAGHRDAVVRRASAVAGPVVITAIVVLLGWSVLVRSHGPVTGAVERLVVVVGLGWLVVVAARSVWRPQINADAAPRS